MTRFPQAQTGPQNTAEASTKDILRPMASGDRPIMVDMEVIVRRQNQEHCASITCMIRHYVARRAKAIEDHPHNADDRMPPATCKSALAANGAAVLRS
jgi:hypothetical protein